VPLTCQFWHFFLSFSSGVVHGFQGFHRVKA
jgi:hypothetical protein